MLGGARAFSPLREQLSELTGFASAKVRLLPGVRAWRPGVGSSMGPVKAGCPTQVCSYACTWLYLPKYVVMHVHCTVAIHVQVASAGLELDCRCHGEEGEEEMQQA